jgi:GT2 family glycosyltransferase
MHAHTWQNAGLQDAPSDAISAERADGAETVGAAVAVSVIVCTCNRAAALLNALGSLARISAKVAWEVLVVDNNSTDGTRDVVEGFIAAGHPHFRYAFEPRQGKSHALNTGLKLARGRLLAFSDDDCMFDPDWINQLTGEFERDPELACVGGRVELYDARDRAQTIRTHKERMLYSPEINQFALIIGCNMAFKRDVFAAVGEFDTDLGPGTGAVFEDLDLIYRAYRQGFKIVYSPEMLVYHNHGRRTEHAAEAQERNYHVGRGAFYCKHALQGDRRVLKMAYWDVLPGLRSPVRRILMHKRHRGYMIALVRGAVYELRRTAGRFVRHVISGRRARARPTTAAP